MIALLAHPVAVKREVPFSKQVIGQSRNRFLEGIRPTDDDRPNPWDYGWLFID